MTEQLDFKQVVADPDTGTTGEELASILNQIKAKFNGFTENAVSVAPVSVSFDNVLALGPEQFLKADSFDGLGFTVNIAGTSDGKPKGGRLNSAMPAKAYFEVEIGTGLTAEQRKGVQGNFILANSSKLSTPEDFAAMKAVMGLIKWDTADSKFKFTCERLGHPTPAGPTIELPRCRVGIEFDSGKVFIHSNGSKTEIFSDLTPNVFGGALVKGTVANGLGNAKFDIHTAGFTEKAALEPGVPDLTGDMLAGSPGNFVRAGEGIVVVKNADGTYSVSVKKQENEAGSGPVVVKDETVFVGGTGKPGVLEMKDCFDFKKYGSFKVRISTSADPSNNDMQGGVDRDYPIEYLGKGGAALKIEGGSFRVNGQNSGPLGANPKPARISALKDGSELNPDVTKFPTAIYNITNITRRTAMWEFDIVVTGGYRWSGNGIMVRGQAMYQASAAAHLDEFVHFLALEGDTANDGSNLVQGFGLRVGNTTTPTANGKKFNVVIYGYK